MSERELNSDDDTSDEEYVPGGGDCEQLSEEENDGDPEDACNSEEDSENKNRKRKTKIKTKKCKKSKREAEEREPEEKPKIELNEEDLKKKTDSLWADFLKDTNIKPRPKAATAETKTSPTKFVTNDKPKEKKQTAPVIFEFAGERIDIPKKSNVETHDKQSTSETTTITPASKFPARKSGGMSSVLNQLGKKQKLSTLEKSKLDWDKFKTDENIDDELRAFNKGKNG